MEDVTITRGGQTLAILEQKFSTNNKKSLTKNSEESYDGSFKKRSMRIAAVKTFRKRKSSANPTTPWTPPKPWESLDARVLIDTTNRKGLYLRRRKKRTSLTGRAKSPEPFIRVSSRQSTAGFQDRENDNVPEHTVQEGIPLQEEKVETIPPVIPAARNQSGCASSILKEPIVLETCRRVIYKKRSKIQVKFLRGKFRKCAS
jgi:hypothetical protein